MAGFRFVHAADLHLDSPLRSLALRNPALAELIGSATRQALARLVDLCLEEQVDALLIAGDLYDGEQTSMLTARFLVGQMKRLEEAGVAVFVVRGNHDAMSRITRELTFPGNVHVFGGRAGVSEMARPGRRPVAVHGLSFANHHAPDSLLPKYRTPVEGALNIALMHTSLDGAEGHDPYAPVKLNELQASGFDYWALGHVHRRAVHAGPRSAVVMPGMPQGRDIGEAGAKSVTIASFGEDGRLHLEERPTAIAEFAHVTLDVTGIEDWRGLLEAAIARLDGARAAVQADHLVARLRLEGTSPLAWRILRDTALLAEDIAQRIDRVWLDRIETACQAPRAAPALAGGGLDPLFELRRLMEEEVVGGPAFASALRETTGQLVRALPAELRAGFGQDEAEAEAVLRDLAREGVAEVLARLHGGARSA